jgi:hypothetical protein
LAVEQGGGHEVVVADGHALADGLLVADEMDKEELRVALPKDVAITALQRRARHDQPVTCARRCADALRDGCEPVAPVGVAERSAGGHTPDVFRRMQAVAFQHGTGELLGEQTCDRRLPRT